MDFPPRTRCKGRFALGLGAVSEDFSLFRTTSSGVFGEIRGGTSQFLTVSASRPVTRKFQVFGAYTQATAKPQTAGGIMSGWRAIRASAFALGLAGRDIWASDDRLSLTLGQPLRVDRARVDLTFPVARRGGNLTTMLGVAANPGHRAEAATVCVWRGALRVGILEQIAAGFCPARESDRS